ncbi:MAG: ClpXP protease specificity-enhancing factor [Aquabacterium sp.]|uniref:ClpXP protease specificity-enhancing factor n=1 Tax=Aquabacterium sp. TaxID=1872578 RepID=UPI0011FF89F8|nr:ClpXP protease specificity-enhancing factor [Aquabacterium sp.]TAK97261.1 MAG: ClpXP protease specificity-enhancing factor [Aquabacterium sp.]
MSTEQDSQGSSTRPYLIRALHDWCTDNGFTPYLAVYVDRSVQVPQEYVKNNEIVLNVSFEATSSLQLGNDYIEFKARFGGMARDICVPTDHVIAIYARENGQGMAFPVPTSLGGEGVDSPSSPDDGGDVAVLHATLPADHPVERAPSLKLAKAGKSDGKDAGSGAAAPIKDRPKAVKPVEVESAPKLVDNGDEPHDPPPTGGGRPALRRIK